MLRRLIGMKRKGQGTLEYVILLSAVIAAILVAAGLIRSKMRTGLENAATTVETNLGKVFAGGATGSGSAGSTGGVSGGVID